jgi:hypothetical protein
MDESNSSFRDHEPVDLVTVCGQLADGEPRTLDIGHSQRMDLGNVLVRELLPGAGVVLLLGVIKMLPARAGHQVDHAVGGRVGLAVKFLVKRPFAANEAAPGRSADVRGRAILRGRHEVERIRSLVVVNMAVEHDVAANGPIASERWSVGRISCGIA